MRRLAATIRTDVRLQFRNGFYAATVLVVIFSIVLLRWLPRETATLLLPVVILENVLMNTFYFVSGLVLLERVEGTFVAQSVTPLRTAEYLGSKLATLTGLSLVESGLIAVAVFGVARWLIAMALGVVLAAALFCLVGVALVVRYDSINEFLLPSVPYTFLLSLPLLGIFGIGADAWYLPHPIQGPLELMRIDALYSGGRLAYAIGYPLVWIVPVYLWSRRALESARNA
jgi:fluoroquinolone transport system permease protein